MKSFKVGLGMLLVMASASAASTADAYYWTPWISEENGVATCDDYDEAARGFGCSGKYCDNARLLCDTLPFGAWPDTENRYWTGYFSEEHDQYSEWYSAGWYPWDNGGSRGLPRMGHDAGPRDRHRYWDRTATTFASSARRSCSWSTASPTGWASPTAAGRGGTRRSRARWTSAGTASSPAWSARDRTATTSASTSARWWMSAGDVNPRRDHP